MFISPPNVWCLSVDILQLKSLYWAVKLKHRDRWPGQYLQQQPLQQHQARNSSCCNVAVEWSWKQTFAKLKVSQSRRRPLSKFFSWLKANNGCCWFVVVKTSERLISSSTVEWQQPACCCKCPPLAGYKTWIETDIYMTTTSFRAVWSFNTFWRANK